MSFANPIVQAGVAGLTSLYAERAVTPVEVCETYLSRIERLGGPLNAFVALDARGARTAAHESAERWRNGRARSPVDGAPIAVKANIAVEGLAWHAGMQPYRDRKALEDAACVARLRAAGAVILGLTNLHEAAFGGTTQNPWFGGTRNPWALDRIPGGSSGGSAAAVAAGLCAGALGTDTLGSVRIPSSLCGVYGHKPTAGLISTEGLVTLSWTLDHVGVHARSAEDCGLLLAAAAGAEPDLATVIAAPAGLEDLRGAPIALLEWEGVEVEPAQRQALADTAGAARKAGLEVEPLKVAGYDFADRSDLFLVAAAESLVVHADAWAGSPEGFSPELRERMGLGLDNNAADLARAYRDLAAAAEEVRGQLSPYSALLMPATPSAATPVGYAQSVNTQFTALANVLGLPASAFPAGLSGAGLPLGVQALAWEDDVALGLARLLGRDLGGPPDFRG